MKFNLRYLANLFVAALLFCATGCKDDDTSGPEMPAVKIAPGATTASSISFTATPEYADAAAYVCVEKGMLIPSAENILANGTALTLDKESLVEVKNLKDDMTRSHCISNRSSSIFHTTITHVIRIKIGIITRIIQCFHYIFKPSSFKSHIPVFNSLFYDSTPFLWESSIYIKYNRFHRFHQLPFKVAF